MNKDNYLFCYSYTLHCFLFLDKKFSYICEAKNKNDLRTFWLYERTKELNDALSEYKEIKMKRLGEDR